MAFNADLQVLTQPGATGNQTYSLASNFDPKAVILWATPLTAQGNVTSYSFGVGFGTYRGSVVQQRYSCIRGLDAAASADTARGGNTDAVLCLLTNTAGSAARDLEIDLVSMQTGATSQVVLDWVNLHSTASIRVFMLVLGGSEITDAVVDDVPVTIGVTSQDETVVAGFGKPELLFMVGDLGSGVFGETAVSPVFSFGFGKQGEAGRGYSFFQTDGNTASITATRQRSDRIFMNTNATGDIVMGRLDTDTANWPTDGFRLLFDAATGNTPNISYLALRTTAQITTGANVALTAGSTQDNACGFVPKLGFFFGWNLVAATTIQTAAADQCGFGIGAYDGATEGWAGFTEDDAALTMFSNSQQQNFAIANWNSAAASQSEANATFSGNNLRLTWVDLDTVAREYQWLAIGDAAVAAADARPVQRVIGFAAGQRAGNW